jgi:hypothetical protein
LIIPAIGGEEIDGNVFQSAPAATDTVYTWVYQW